MSMIDTISIASLHEAGHVVAGLKMFKSSNRFQVLSVELYDEPEGSAGGGTQFFLEEGFPNSKELNRFGVTLFAGMAALVLARTDIDDLEFAKIAVQGAQDDLDKFNQACTRLGAKFHEKSRPCLRRAQRLVSKHCDEILQVARFIEEFRRLDRPCVELVASVSNSPSRSAIVGQIVRAYVERSEAGETIGDVVRRLGIK